MPHLALNLLGTFHATLDGTTISNFESNKVRALLAYLAVESDRPHSRDALAGFLWPDISNRTAHDNLRYALSDLRDVIHDREACPPFLSITRDTIQLNPASDFQLDVCEWQSALEQSPIPKLESLASGYRGVFLEGFSCDSAPFEEWVLLTRERINQQVLHVLRALAAHNEERGKYNRVETYTRKQLELEPWDEQAHQALMRVLAQNGQRNGALVQYETCRRVLNDELGVEPSHETTALYESIRDGTFARRTPNNLPISLTSFVGREREISEVKQLLRTTRLLTLTGAGGCGKTRLAMQVVLDIIGKDGFEHLYTDGIWWVNLAPLNDPALVPQTIAATFDLSEMPNQSLMAILTNYFRSKELLLILDNCEHLVNACALLVGTLQSACPKIHFLVTSREQLNVSGEFVWYVPSLRCAPSALPLEQLRQYDAIQLFVERARAIAPHWSLAGNSVAVAEICARLDGIPLAIELAAARLDRLSAKEIETQLADRFSLLVAKGGTVLPRHQTLRAAMDWSYDLLNDAERRLFARLGVFLGGCTIQAVEAICRDEDSSVPVSDELTLLMDKSLLQRAETDGEPRLVLIETIRSYAVEKLNASAEVQTVRRKHLAYYVAMAEQLEPRLWGSESLAAGACLEKESANLAVALERALGSDSAPDIELGARLAGALWYYWATRGALTEGRRWLERAISKKQTSVKARAKILTGAANLVWQQGNYAVARGYFEESISLWRELGTETSPNLAETQHTFGHLVFDQRDYFTAHNLFTASRAYYQSIGDENFAAILNSDLGMVSYHQGDYAAARQQFESSLAWLQGHGNESYAAETRGRLGDLARLAGDYDKAAAYYESSLAWFRKEKSNLGIASCLHKLAYVAQHRRDYTLAEKNLVESMKLQNESDNKQGIAECLAGMAGLAAAAGQPARAAHLFAATRGLLDAIGAPLAPADLAEWKRDEVAARAQLDRATFDAAWADGRAMALEQAVAYALENTNAVET